MFLPLPSFPSEAESSSRSPTIGRYGVNQPISSEFELAGCIRILNLDLTPVALDSLDFPFSCSSASINLIEVKIPWFWWMLDKSIEVEISGLEVEGSCRKHPTFVSPEVHDAKLKTQRAALRRNTLRTVEIVLWDDQPNRLITFWGRIWRRVHQTFLHWILQDCHIHFQRFKLCLQTGPGQSPDQSCVLALEVSIRSFELNCTGEEDDGGTLFTCEAGLKGLTIDVLKKQGDSNLRSNVLRQWYCGSEIIWHHSQDVENCEELSIKIDTNALLLTFSYHSIHCITNIAFQFLEYYTFMPYRTHRPQESVFQNPIKWWHHAGNSIIHEIARVCSTRRLVTGIQQRRRIRKEYEQIYRRYRHIKGWSWLLVPFLGTKRSAIRALWACEENLSTLEIAEFRWWCWARRMRNIRPEEIHLKLREIYNLISAEDAVAHTNERWKLKSTITCPKISLTLALDDNSGVCLSLHTLKLAVQSGTLENSKYHTVEGPLEMSMSCSSLEVTHSNLTSKKTTIQGFGLRKQHSDDEHQWIIRSPSPREVDLVQQKFVSLNYEKPRLDSLLRRKLKVEVAPIDLSFVEKALLQMVTFTARMISVFSQQGYYLEPLDLRMAIEEAVGETNESLRQDAPSQQLQLQANVGDVNLRIPCRGGSSNEEIGNQQHRQLKRSHHMRRHKPSAHRLSRQHPVLVVVLGGFSLSTEIDEVDESMTKTISLTESFSFREAMLKHPDPSSGSAESSEIEDLMESGSSELTSAESEESELPSMSGKLFARRLSIAFKMQVFLADLYSPGGTEIHRSVQLLKELQIQSIINTWIETSFTEEIKQIMKVQLHTSPLEFCISAFSLLELSQLAENLYEVKRAFAEFCSIVFQPPDTSKDFYLRSESFRSSSYSSRQITPYLELSIRIPNFTMSFYHGFSFDDDISDLCQRLGHVKIDKLEIIDKVDDAKTEINFVIRRVEVVCDNIIGVTALNRTTASQVQLPFTILKPTPAALVPPFMTERKLKFQSFQEWRRMLRKDTHKTELDPALFSQIQLTGKIDIKEGSAFFAVTSAFLTLCIDNQVIDTCVAYYQDLIKHCHFSDSIVSSPVGQANAEEGTDLIPPRTKSEMERSKVMVNGDFGFGCVRICCSIDGRQVTTISSTCVRGKAEHQYGHSIVQTFSLSIEDVILIDHLAASPLHHVVLDGNFRCALDSLDENCGVTISFESSAPSSTVKETSTLRHQHQHTDSQVSSMQGIQQRTMESKTSSLKISFSRSRLVFVHRFIKDLEKFLDLAIWQYLKEPPSKEPEDQNPSMFSFEVEFRDFHMIIPKCSWSDEFYAVTGQLASIALPASRDYVKNLKESLLATCDQREGSTFEGFWNDMMQTSTVHSSSIPGFCPVPDLHCAFSKFSQDSGSNNRICIYLEDAKMDWGIGTPSKDRIYRLVLDGGNMFILIDGIRTEIFCPDARCVMGEVQYGLIMDFISQNYNEKGTFETAESLNITPGDPVPSPVNPPESLGINEDDQATLEVQVQFLQCSFLLERPLLDSPVSLGHPHAEMSLSDPLLTYTVYKSGSTRVQIMAEGAVLNDIRDAGFNGYTIPVVVINPQSSGDTNHLIELSNTSQKRWAEVWKSFKPMKEGPGDHLDQSMEETTSPGSGIVFDYVLQQRGKHCQSGPHVLEVVMLGADLAWPYYKDFGFFRGISEPFLEYSHRQSCSLYPQNEGPDQWMYINCIMKNSRMKIPLQESKMMTTYFSRRYCNLQSSYFEGIEFCWDSTRVGYFYGGDGETHLKINLRQFLANLKETGTTPKSSVFLKPLDGGLTVRWHSSKLQTRTETTSMNCFWNHLCFVFKTEQDLLLRKIYSQFNSISGDQGSSPEDSEITINTFRAWLMKYRIRGQSFTVVLEDSIGDLAPEPVFQLSLSNSQLNLYQDQKLQSSPRQTNADFSGSLEILYQNAALDALDPFIESWPFSFNYRNNGTRKSFNLGSSARMNVLATPAVFNPLASVRAFGNSCLEPPELTESTDSLNSLDLTIEADEEPPIHGKYKLINKTGILLSYGVEESADSSPSRNYPVNPGETTFLEVNPVEKEVLLAHANTKVKTQTIIVSFAGNWDPIKDVVVDKVGKYGYSLRSALTQREVSVIVDISIEDRLKVISIHSTYKINNQIDRKMRFFVNLISKEETGPSNDAHKSAVHTCVLPMSGYLDPGSQTYLPVTECPVMMVYLKVTGFKKAEKDVIKIEDKGQELSHQQGLYTCPEVNDGPCSFHCCMEVQRTSLKTAASSRGGVQIEIQEHSMIFHPVLTIQNLLPVSMEATFSCTPEAHSLRPDYHQINEGGSVPVNNFDLSKVVKCKLKIPGFENQLGADIAPSRKLKGPVKPLSSVKTVRMQPTQQGLMQGDHRSHLKSFKLSMREARIGHSGAKRVQLFCPYWILNKTTKHIMVKDRKTQLIPHLTAMPLEDKEDWAPALFSSPRSTAFIAVATTFWSKGINLNSVGLKDSVSVLAPCEEGEIGEESEMIRPHGVIPRQPGILASFNLRPAYSASSLLSGMQGRESGESGDDEEAENEELIDDDRRKVPKFSRLDFAVSIHLGPGQFDSVKVLKISPRYILYNHSGQNLQIGQLTTSKSIEIEAGDHVEYYWFDSEAPQQICVRPTVGTWCYSGGFRLNEVNDFGLRIRNPRRVGCYTILNVDVSLRGDSMVCVFYGTDDKDPPYKIENDSEVVTVHFVQKGGSRQLPFDIVETKTDTMYAWDYPLRSHRLSVRIIEKGSPYFHSREYTLDSIKTHPPIVLKKRSGLVRGIRQSLEIQEQPVTESLTSEKVYVQVLAKGATRIIRFSDRDDDHNHSTNEEASAFLTSRKLQLRNDISTVYTELAVFQKQSGIDMTMMLNKKQKKKKLIKDHISLRSVSEENCLLGAPIPEQQDQSGLEGEEETGSLDQEGNQHRKRRNDLRRWANILSCGFIPRQRISAPITSQIKIPEELTTLPIETPQLTSTSPFAQMRSHPTMPDPEPDHGGEISHEVEDPQSSSQHHSSILTKPPLSKKISFKDQIEEWDDPSLCRLSRKLTLKRKTTGTLIDDDGVPMGFTSTEGEEMIGGELLIKVHSARGLRNEDDQLDNTLSKTRNRFMRLASEPVVYAHLECNGQTRRTKEVPFDSKVVWDEIVSFPSVPVGSFVMLTVIKKGMMREYILGEKLLPLHTIERSSQLEMTEKVRVELSRNKGGHQVLFTPYFSSSRTFLQARGDIELSVGWRSTPLGRLTLQVRDLQQELDDLEELLAMMKARSNPQKEEAYLMEDLKYSSEISNSRIPIGRLEVKVIEGRNLSVSPDRIKNFYNSGVYGVLTCERESGKGINFRTSTAKDRLAPFWGDSFTFNDVDLTSKLMIQFFDFRRMRSDEFLGQIKISVFNLHDGKPHYSWVYLQSNPEHKDKKISGEINIRVRWKDTDSTSTDADEDSGFSVNLTLAGFGISLIESSPAKLPRELMHVLFDDLSCEYSLRGKDVSGQVKLKNMQIDNQLVTSVHPVVFAHSKTLSESPEHSENDQQQKPMLEIRLEKLNDDNPQLVHIRYFTFLLQEMDLVLEEDFLDLLMLWFEELPLEALSTEQTQKSTHPDQDVAEIGTFMNRLKRKNDFPHEFAESIGQSFRWYIEVLHIQPIKVNITLLASPAMDIDGHSRRYRKASALGINILDLTNFPLKINAMLMKNAFMRREELIRQVVRHMKWQALYGVYKLLGTVELLGTPVLLGNSIMAGVASFFYEPAKGIVHGPEEFARGVATGTVHLIKNSMYGVLNTFGNFTEGVGKTLAMLSLDESYFQRFQSRPRSKMEKVVEGARLLKMGIVQGVTGIVVDPYQGATDRGIRGFSKGVVTGLFGVILKPASGLLNLAASMASGIGDNIMEIGDKVNRGQRVRVRAPRDFGIHVGANATEAQLLLWKQTILDVDDRLFLTDTVLDFLRQDNLVLIITDKHLTYLNFVKKRVLWCLEIHSLTNVETVGLDVNICYVPERRREVLTSLSLRQHKKRINCKTKQTQQQLLVKISNAIRARDHHDGIKGITQTPSDTPFLPSHESLRIMNTAPPSVVHPDGLESDLEIVKNPSQQLDDFEGLYRDFNSILGQQEAVSRPAPQLSSTSGTPPIEKLRILANSEKPSLDFKVDALRQRLIEFYELTLTLMSHQEDDHLPKDILSLIHDSTQPSVLNKIQERNELVSKLTTVQYLSQLILST